MPHIGHNESVGTPAPSVPTPVRIAGALAKRVFGQQPGLAEGRLRIDAADVERILARDHDDAVTTNCGWGTP